MPPAGGAETIPASRARLRAGLGGLAALAGVVLAAMVLSWTVALTQVKPLCVAEGLRRGLAYDGLSLGLFSQGNRVAPCRFSRADGTRDLKLRWRELAGATALMRIAVRPDLMSYALAIAGIAGWLLLSRAVRRT